ncbi:MAG: hypothetical protein AB1894_24775 [Chloroflexota bacterium]
MKHFVVGLAILALILAGIACADTPELASTSVPDGGEGLFQYFYDYRGGEKILGKVISDIQEEGETKMQFTENAKMVWDPNAPMESRFSLASLGLKIGYSEPAILPSNLPGYHYLNGHAVPQSFYDKFNAMGGKDVVGWPITEVLFDPVTGRYFQYFERVGFYRLRSNSEVRLLPYGLMMCSQECRRPKYQDAVIESLPQAIHPAFQAEVERLGIDFTGFAIRPAYLTPEGKLRQVMMNVVLETSSPGQPGGVRLYPFVKQVNIVAESPRPNQQSEGMYFLATDGALGFEIPQYFWGYLREHGGVQTSGLPVTHLAPDKQGYRQCFTNLCLSYQPDQPRPVNPEPLGSIFAILHLDNQPKLTPAPIIQRYVTITVWDDAHAIDSSQQQVIRALVQENDAPVANVVLVLELKLPDDRREEKLMPPTGVDGKTSLRLEPIQARNGSLVLYRACYLQSEASSYCTPQESFVVWGNP